MIYKYFNKNIGNQEIIYDRIKAPEGKGSKIHLIVKDIIEVARLKAVTIQCKPDKFREILKICKDNNFAMIMHCRVKVPSKGEEPYTVEYKRFGHSTVLNDIIEEIQEISIHNPIGEPGFGPDVRYGFELADLFIEKYNEVHGDVNISPIMTIISKTKSPHRTCSNKECKEVIPESIRCIKCLRPIYIEPKNVIKCIKCENKSWLGIKCPNCRDIIVSEDLY